MKAPTNKSLSWNILAAASPLALLVALAKNFAPEVLHNLPSKTTIASYGLFTAAGLLAFMQAHDYISSLPQRRMKVAFENTGLYIEKDAGIRLPRLKRKEKMPWGWRFHYSLPIGLCKSDLEKMREEIEAALEAEVNFAWNKGLIRADILQGEIPSKVAFKQPELEGEIPFTVGVGRAGLITADLTSCYHLLVAGQIGSGKSNFLHQLILSMLTARPDIKLYIIDLKKVEFAYLSGIATATKFTLKGSVEVLESLTKEMEWRKDFLSREGFVSAKEWRKANPDKKENLPYHVLVVDEFSQLCPVLSKGQKDRETRNYTHKLLTDLISTARSLGIQTVIATQYPHHEILPGAMKQNIPATVAFKCRTRVNSQVCLDNDRAADLPSPQEIPGRAIWQHIEEREVQTYFLPLEEARRLIKKNTLPRTPLPADNLPKKLKI